MKGFLLNETSHAIAQAMCTAAGMSKDQVVVINVSGREDKNLYGAVRLLGIN